MKINILNLLFLQIIIFSCTKEESENFKKLEIITSQITNITNTNAICGGNIISDGGKTITATGIVWHTSNNATLKINTGITISNTSAYEYTSELKKLNLNTKYFVRAYSINEEATIYGDEKTFTTTNFKKAEIITSEISGITNTTAICGGSIINDGGKTVTSSGIVWSTSKNPSKETNDGIIIQADNIDNFTSKINNLKEGTLYFIRAYATNELGISYGEQKSFETNRPIEMINVQGGSFMMGNNEFYDENPVHKVTLSSFEIGKYEITQAQWRRVMGNNPSFWIGDNRPVEKVSWKDVHNFIKKLNEKTGLTYRLPTESEWEFAARGGNYSKGYIYSGSNNIDDVAWYMDNTTGGTNNIGTKQANELGIYDMTGNVWEWCSDWYGAYSSNDTTNPTGVESGSNRVFRGGVWSRDAKSNHLTVRYYYYYPSGSNYSVGFRLARSL